MTPPRIKQTVRPNASHFQRRRNLPAIWLMVDSARLRDPEAAIAALPHGSGVILRDYDRPDRARWAAELARICRLRHLLFLVAGDARLARAVRADGVHWPQALARCGGFGCVSMAVHDPAGLVAARRIGADLVLISPVFATASHPGARPLGPGRFAALALRAPCPAYALGGVHANAMTRLRGAGAAGFAAIGAFAS